MIELGQIVATPNALSRISPEEVNNAIRRHASGDWGDTSPADAKLNDACVKAGEGRVFSVYHIGKEKLWVITEADRSSTCALLPEDY